MLSHNCNTCVEFFVTENAKHFAKHRAIDLYHYESRPPICVCVWGSARRTDASLLVCRSYRIRKTVFVIRPFVLIGLAAVRLQWEADLSFLSLHTIYPRISISRFASGSTDRTERFPEVRFLIFAISLTNTHRAAALCSKFNFCS